MRTKILYELKTAMEGLQRLSTPEGVDSIELGIELIVSCYRQGGKLLVAGNGGSLCDAMHFAEELTGFFRDPRPALAAIALADPGHLTCVGNDFGFERIFSRAIEALGREGDLFVGLSTSGNSVNLIRAFEAAKARGLKTLALLGRGGGALKGVADLQIVIEGQTSDRIQEVHKFIIHMMIQGVEEALFPAIPRQLAASR